MRWLSPPRQRAGGARQRQVIEADVEQEGQPLADLLQHADGDFVLLGVERCRHAFEPFAGAAHRQFRDLADMLAADLDAQRFRLQPVAVAAGTGDVGEILCQLLARPFALGLAKAALEVGDDALERLFGIVGADAVFVGELDLVVAGAMKKSGLRLLRQVLPFGVERELVELCRARSASGCNRARTIWPRARSRPCARSSPCRE